MPGAGFPSRSPPRSGPQHKATEAGAAARIVDTYRTWYPRGYRFGAAGVVHHRRRGTSTRSTFCFAYRPKGDNEAR